VGVSALLEQIKQIAIAGKRGLSEKEVINLAQQLFRNNHQIKTL
jgi:hypothetical protein